MKSISAATVLAIALIANAQPTVTMQPHVQSYLKGTGGKHRSGLVSAKDYGSNYEEIKEGERVRLVSFENPYLPGKESFLEIKDIISKNAGKHFQSVVYHDNVAYLDSCKSAFKVDVSNLKKNQNQESKRLLKHLFSDAVAKKFDLFVVGTEYIGGSATQKATKDGYEYVYDNAPQTESGYKLMFQRLYEGRIVRHTEGNYLNIDIGNDGSIKSMEIAWQDLFPTGKSAAINNNLAEITRALETAAKIDYSAIEMAGDTLAVNSFYVNGAARAWCKVAVEGNNVLFPCLSYSLDIGLSNGEAKPAIVNAPYSVHYQGEFMGIAILPRINKNTEVK